MRSVNIAELKARLSAHIRRVREGEEIVICERNQPVARIIPCPVENYSEQEKRLIARGVLRPPLKNRQGPLPQPAKPVGRIPNGVMERIWREEREGR
jgi:prevent-host-death family protein